MSRIGQQYYCKEEDEVVSRDELIKGYEIRKGEYIPIEPEELEALEPESSSNLNIDQFIDISEVDPVYYERSYYVVPAEEGTEKAYGLLVEAMKNKNRAALGKLLMRDREYLALVRPNGKGLVLETLHFPDEIRSWPRGTVKAEKVREKERELAGMLVDSLTEPFDPARYEDEYQKRVQQLIEAKSKGKRAPKFKEKKIETVPNIMEALERSLKIVGKGSKRPQAHATRKTA
jgi:DNA end-binding protein Ku